MIDRQAILPLTLGLLIAVIGHLALSAEVARWTTSPTDADPRPVDAPDLAIDAVDVKRLVPIDQPLVANLTLRNLGDRPSAPTTLRWARDPRPASSQPPPPTDQPIPALEPGASVPRQVELTFPEPGAYRLTLALDPDRDVADRDRANNRRTVTILAIDPAGADPDRPGLPDLVPVSIEPIGPLFAGRPASLAVRVANVGNAPADPVALDLELDGTPVATAMIDQPLPPGRVVRKRVRVVVDQPRALAVCLIVDPSRTVEEANEANNRLCTELRWRSIDSMQRPGDPARADEVTVNWISYDAFRELRSNRQSSVDQALVQRSAEPVPVDRAPLQATPPAPDPAEQLAGIPDPTRPMPTPAPTPGPAPDSPVPTAPSTETGARTPSPADPADPPATQAATPAAEPDPENAAERSTSPAAPPASPRDAPDGAEPARTPELPDVARGEEAAAAVDDPADDPRPIDPTPRPSPAPRVVVVPEARPVEPDDAAPDLARPADLPELANPPIAIPALPDAGRVPAASPALPPAEQAALRAPPLPPVDDPAPARETRPQDQGDREEPDPAAVALDPRLDAPLAAPDPIAETPEGDARAPASPQSDNPAESTESTEAAAPDDRQAATDRAEPAEDRPVDAATVNNPTPDPATPRRPTDAGGRTGGQTGRPSNPTAAPRDRREAVAAARIADLQVRPGEVVARRGVRINTIAPRFTVPTRLAAVPRSPLYNIRFNAKGKVVDVETIRSTGYASVDSPLIIAIYKWTAEGRIADDGFLLERLQIHFGDPGDPEDDPGDADDEDADAAAREDPPDPDAPSD